MAALSTKQVKEKITGRSKPLHRIKLNCNFISLLTQCMGNENVIRNILDSFEAGYTPTGPLIISSKGSVPEEYRGLISMVPTLAAREARSSRVNEGIASHFYWQTGKGHFNSYQGSLKWQLPKSNQFCQTFAIMGYLSDLSLLKIDEGTDTSLLYNKFHHNAESALKFIRDHGAYYIAHIWEEECARFEGFYDKIGVLEPDEIKKDITKILDTPEGKKSLEIWMSDGDLYY